MCFSWSVPFNLTIEVEYSDELPKRHGDMYGKEWTEVEISVRID